MRVNIEVPLPSKVSQKSSVATSAPPTLIKLAPSGELFLIELQGSLEIDDAHPEGGQALGKLEFHEGREDRPTLLISHHRLEGKIVALTKPFAVLEKKKRSIGQVDRKETNIPSRKELASSPLLSSRSVNRVHDRDEDERGEHFDETDEPTSPSMARKRARGEVGRVTHQTPIKAALDRNSMVTSSSPMPRAPLRGSELDFSSPMPAPRQNITSIREQDLQDDGQEWVHKKSTSTYFEVVCIIRKKILFTKRPEPVVRLDGEGGEEARKALGL